MVPINSRNMTCLILFVFLILIPWGCGSCDSTKETGPDMDPSTAGGKKEVPVDSSGPFNAAYIIEGQEIRLHEGKASKQAAPGSATMIRTLIFGNPQYGDLNHDGFDDAVVLLGHLPGGSGNFFYVAAALFDGSGWKGTRAVFLGDRIIPESIEIKNGLVTVHYLDRRPDEPFSTPAAVETEKKMILNGNALSIVNDE